MNVGGRFVWAEYPFGHPGVWSGKETSFLFNKYFFETDSWPVSGDEGVFISDCVEDLFFLYRMDKDKQESKKKEELENRKEFVDKNENEENENEYEEVNWDNVMEEEKSSEELLKEYNESLMKLTRIENKVRGMNRFAQTLERGKEEYRIRDVVFKTYEELYYKLKRDVLKEVQEYNHIVSGWKMESKEMEKLGAELLLGYLDEDVCGVSKKVLEAAEREKN